MLPFVAHQALAHSRLKQKAAKPASSKPELRSPSLGAKRKSIFLRAFEAVATSRMRRAEIELAHYQRTRDEITGK